MVEYRSEKAVRNSFVLTFGGEKGTEVLWTARALLFLNTRDQDGSQLVDFLFIPAMECTDLSDEDDKLLGYMCEGWSSVDEVDCTFETLADSEKTKRLRVKEVLGVELFYFMEGTMNVVHSKTGLEPFTRSLHWLYLRFSVNRSMKPSV